MSGPQVIISFLPVAIIPAMWLIRIVVRFYILRKSDDLTHELITLIVREIVKRPGESSMIHQSAIGSARVVKHTDSAAAKMDATVTGDASEKAQ